MPDAPIDVAAAHRWFAAECNNAAWTLIGREARSTDEDLLLVHLAHASVWHWLNVGAALHWQRGAVLLANAYAATGQGEGAVLHAKRALALLETAPEGLEDWDRAFTYDAAARAYAVAGTFKTAARYRALSREAGDAIADAEDRAIFDAHYARFAAREVT
jgi:hypothetical protein